MKETHPLLFLKVQTPNKDNDRISRLAWLLEEEGAVKAMHETALDPETYFDEENSTAQGITPLEVHGFVSFDELWKQLEDPLKHAVIVGSDTAFDLEVLARTMTYYELDTFPVEFLDIAEKGEQIFTLDAYDLDHLAAACHMDMRVSPSLLDQVYGIRMIYHHFADQNLWTPQDIRFFNLMHGGSRRDRLTADLVELKGKLLGIRLDETTSEEEIELIQDWVNRHGRLKFYAQYRHFQDALQELLDSTMISPASYFDLIRSLDHWILELNEQYSPESLALETLRGILSGLNTDQVLSGQEIALLKGWMENSRNLQGMPPYDTLCGAVEEVLADGRITVQEADWLKTLFDKYAHAETEGVEKQSSPSAEKAD